MTIQIWLEEGPQLFAAVCWGCNGAIVAAVCFHHKSGPSTSPGPIARFWDLFVTRWLFAPPRCRLAPTWCGIDLRSCHLILGFVCNTLALCPSQNPMRKFLFSLPPTLVHYIFLNSHLTRIFFSRIHIFKGSF